MTLIDTFGDAISSLQTDEPSSQVSSNEIEMAETLFTKLANKYKSKRKEEYDDEEDAETPSKEKKDKKTLSSIQLILKRSVLVAILVLLLLTPFVRARIQAFSEHTFVYYIFVFVCVIIGATIVQKAVN